ncbi:unnamed protein product [Gordionus sp. m RMFG-2023]
METQSKLIEMTSHYIQITLISKCVGMQFNTTYPQPVIQKEIASNVIKKRRCLICNADDHLVQQCKVYSKRSGLQSNNRYDTKPLTKRLIRSFEDRYAQP